MFRDLNYLPRATLMKAGRESLAGKCRKNGQKAAATRTRAILGESQSLVRK